MKKRLYYFIKRLFDIIISFFVVILLIPISLIFKLIYIICGDFKPIFYLQKRIGKNGKIFKIIKYRTMVIDADKKLDKLLDNKKLKNEWDNNQKINNDPRITRVGSFLRKHAIDEIPQFINILKGDMSLVGPRPLILNELDRHNGDHKIYESIKPGLTGWWVVNKKKCKTYKERLDYEYYYINNQSIGLDIKCILKTIKVIF